MSIFDLLREPEVLELKEKYHEITGVWLPYHWDCFESIDEYKEYMKRTIEEHEYDATGT